MTNFVVDDEDRLNEKSNFSFFMKQNSKNLQNKKVSF
jgi:hypothetical protein